MLALALLVLLADATKPSCAPPDPMLRILRESRPVRLVRLASRAERTTDPFARETTFVGFRARDAWLFSPAVDRALARAFGRRDVYACEGAAEKDPAVRWPVQVGFVCASSEGDLQLVLLEPERRLLMYLGTGTFRDVPLSVVGSRECSRLLETIARERRQSVTELLAWLAAPADTGASTPAPMAGRATADSSAVDLRKEKPVDAYMKVSPKWPESRTAVTHGVVAMDVLVGADGTVHDVRVTQSVPELDDAAMVAVRRWRYQPLTRDGVARSFWTKVELEFATH